MRITRAEATELFVGSDRDPLQVVAVTLRSAADGAVTPQAPATVRVDGDGASTPQPATVRELAPGAESTVEIGVRVARHLRPGAVVRAEVRAESASGSDRRDLPFVVAEPGWRMFLVSHFHYDPVWWNTQAFYTETWEKLSRAQRPWEGRRQQPAFTLLDAHLDMARRDPDYKFVLAELDYLKPFWDAFPGERSFVRRLLAEGRLELVGGTYNEPNTNLTCAESTIRNAVYGIGYQRHVLGGDPATAWQLDVFGHDPQFPGLMADAGLTSSSWARGPFHQWGPRRAPGGNARMQLDSEFDWVAPSGRSLLTSYMPNHYSAGWDLDHAPTLAAAEQRALELFRELRVVAATRNVLLPVGTDYTPPNRWITEIHRSWNRRYCWPKFSCALPREFFAAVRAELAERGVAPVPQSRDMNPVYTGKDVSYIDTKQAQRVAENVLLCAEKFATLAALRGARYPVEAFDKAWRQLLFGAHHDGITGTESDQVYLDLLGGWREALELAREGLDGALAFLGEHIDTRGGQGLALTLFNALSWSRTDVVQATVRLPQGADGLRIESEDGGEVPCVVEAIEHDGEEEGASATVRFVAPDVPGVGYRSFRLLPAPTTPDAAWTPVNGRRISNDAFEVSVDSERGGVIDRLVDRRSGRSLLREGGLANEVRAYDEYPTHPQHGEGPWHLLPLGTVLSQAEQPATVVAQRSAIGERLIVHARIGAVCNLVQVISLYQGVRRVDCSTVLDGFSGQDTLFRVRMQADVPGGMPLAEVGNAVIGRGFGHPEVDVADAPYTLDNPAYNWFGIGSTARVELVDEATGRPRAARAWSVAEVVVAGGDEHSAVVRELVVALVRTGVTATVSRATGSRYGSLDADSNLPDVRVSVGGPQDNPFTAAVLAAAPPAYGERLHAELAASGVALVWVPAAKPLSEVLVPNADLRAPDALPVLVVAGADARRTTAALAAVAADLADAVVTVPQPEWLDGGTGTVADATVAVLNRGMPGCNVDAHGDLHLSLMRSCSGWPSGVWLDPPRRTVPDGSSFQLQHWTHRFEYAITGGAGDWRTQGIVRRGHEHNTPLEARVLTPHRGTLPASGHLVRVDGDGILLTALKPAGDPLARMAAPAATLSSGITLRCYEPHGAAARGSVTLPGHLDTAYATDVLERARAPLRVDGRRISLTLHAFETATVLAMPAAGGTHGESRELARRHELAQPVFSDYWLHNRGAAPLGYQPVTVAIPLRAVRADGAFVIPVTVASERTDDAVAVRLRMVVPPGWTAVPDTRLYRLAPGAHAELDVRVHPADAVLPGRYFVAARITDASGQESEDVVTVDVGDPYHPQPHGGEPGRTLLLERATRKAAVVEGAVDVATTAPIGGELSASLLHGDIDASADRPDHLAVELRSSVASEIRGEAQVISPFGTWEAIRPSAQGFTVPAGGRSVLRFLVQPPAATPATCAWLLVKLGYFGRVLYTRSVAVRLQPTARRTVPDGR